MIDDATDGSVAGFRSSSGRLPLLSPDELDERQREVYEAVTGGPRSSTPAAFRIRDDEGRLLGPFNAMLHAPEIGLPLQELGAALRFRGSLTRREREIATLVVAVRARSEYEWYAHERLGRRAGLTAEELDSLRLGRTPTLPTARERVVHELARSLAEDGDVADAVYAEAVATLGRSTLVELVTLVGYYQALALQLRVFQIGAPDEGPADE